MSIRIFQCPECGLHYNEKNVAEQCEAWCKEHKSCNLEIATHAIECKRGVRPHPNNLTRD